MSFRSTTYAALAELFKRLTSRRLWMVIFACSVPWLGLERGVNHLYALSPAQAGVYGGMFLAVMGGIVAIVCKYMGIENINVSAATSVTGALTSAASHAFSRREEKIESEHTERIIHEAAERFKDDPSYRPVQPDTGEVFR